MKKLVLSFALMGPMVPAYSAFAEGEKATTQNVDAVKEINSGAKKSNRKKKVEMCNECGKPESECECETKEGEKKK